MRRLSLLTTGVVTAALAATGLVAGPAAAVDEVNTTKLRDAVTVGGILAHERVLQRISNQNGGTRASGTAGYAASAAYVKKTLKQAGYSVKEQTFTFPFFRELAPATVSQTAPSPTDYETLTFEYSGSGDVTGSLTAAAGINVPPPAAAGTTTSGCQVSDFPPAGTAPAVALVQRGTCTFGTKAANAQTAGYDAVIIFNEGQPGRTATLTGTLGTPVDIPAVGLSFADGAALYAATQAGPVTVSVSASTETDLEAETTNIIADSPKGDPNNVITVGAHLDSVVEGPGINDNGSGTSAILEIAKQISELKIKPRQQLRFAFWGAEESGLLGSQYYVDNLSDTALAKIKANLNFDMLGSPNYVRFVYDGDGSSEGVVGPAGSGEIEKIFTDYFGSQNLASAPTAFDGRSDYGPFIGVGIPAGGLFSGAEGIKTVEQAATYGGTAGAAYDACYHQACDDINNLSTKALSELGDAAAHAVMTLAVSKTGIQVDGSFRQAPSAGRVAAPVSDYQGHSAIR